MDQTQHALPAHPRTEVRASRNARLAERMDRMPHVTPAHGPGKRPRATRRRVRATAAAAGVCSLVLLAAPCDAQTVLPPVPRPRQQPASRETAHSGRSRGCPPLRTETAMTYNETIMTQLGRPVLCIAHGPAELAKEQAMNILTQRLPGLPVGLLRMMFGLLWLQAALQKAPWVINTQGQRFGWLSNWLWTETQHPTFGFYKAMLEIVVLPHFTFFGYLSFVVGLALGVSLLLGLLTVLSGIGGTLWQCNIAIGSYAVPGEWGWICPLLIAPHLVFAFSHAGRSIGADLFLYHWLSKDPKGPVRHWAVSTPLGIRDQQWVACTLGV